MKKEVEEDHTFFLFLCRRIILFIIVLKFQVKVRLCGMSIYLTKGRKKKKLEFFFLPKK
jgi:hypothetical protein